MSYSIEFAFWPDFAGNSSHPNIFSENLLANLGDLQGVRPYLRIGGNTQDYALYDPDLPVAINSTYNFTRSEDYPTTITIGPSYFDSYRALGATKYTHGFNLALGAITSHGWNTLAATAPLACKAIGQNIDHWEYGNEPDLYSVSAQGPVRPPTWDAASYVDQWLNGTRHIRQALATTCPGTASAPWVAPSNGGVSNPLRAQAQWAAGLDDDNNVGLLSTHNYISGAESPGVTLQDTLMNHDETMRSVDAHVRTRRELIAQFGESAIPPHIIGEHNSLYHQGKPGLSNSFGAALWGVDFNLYAASQGIRRVHMHMGTDYRYASWQPITTAKTVTGTKPPYYGNIAVAAFLSPQVGPSVSGNSTVSAVHIPLAGRRAAAYAAYVSSHLARLIVINLEAYNSTVNGTGEVNNPDAPDRPQFTYAFQLPGMHTGGAFIQRLSANGSDAISGITWDGWSYNRELDGGKPVRLRNVTVGERVPINKGVVKVKVAASEAVMISLEGDPGED
ncbi:beta-glucuronidase [Plectosphaerella plurivora]|uniref:Beta-glucuronidase n=1 Tax=Plectosphaerella plurivora TaxID=936078 RepID=A0A9P8VI54_9PEZI|nr:beta-glucuronidase [Plectosphaerella plurivora]